MAVSVWAPLPPPTICRSARSFVGSVSSEYGSRAGALLRRGRSMGRAFPPHRSPAPSLSRLLLPLEPSPRHAPAALIAAAASAPLHILLTLYSFSTLDTVTLPPSSVFAPVSILTPAQSFPMRARASVTETRNAPPRRITQDARCAGRGRHVEESGGGEAAGSRDGGRSEEAGMRWYCAMPCGRKRERGPPAIRVQGSGSIRLWMENTHTPKAQAHLPQLASTTSPSLSLPPSPLFLSADASSFPGRGILARAGVCKPR
ncbi:hypothetical protein B0H19DRAFT_382372 [Mycena capillaripes]|nr:hypothetical protein B0H19DRAFT_382372 [Mycena capillaripes]